MRVGLGAGDAGRGMGEVAGGGAGQHRGGGVEAEGQAAAAGIAERVALGQRQAVGAVAVQGDAGAPAAIGLHRGGGKRGGAAIVGDDDAGARLGGAGIADDILLRGAHHPAGRAGAGRQVAAGDVVVQRGGGGVAGGVAVAQRQVVLAVAERQGGGPAAVAADRGGAERRAALAELHRAAGLADAVQRHVLAAGRMIRRKGEDRARPMAAAGGAGAAEAAIGHQPHRAGVGHLAGGEGVDHLDMAAARHVFPHRAVADAADLAGAEHIARGIDEGDAIDVHRAVIVHLGQGGEAAARRVVAVERGVAAAHRGAVQGVAVARHDHQPARRHVGRGLAVEHVHHAEGMRRGVDPEQLADAGIAALGGEEQVAGAVGHQIGGHRAIGIAGEGLHHMELLVGGDFPDLAQVLVAAGGAPESALRIHHRPGAGAPAVGAVEGMQKRLGAAGQVVAEHGAPAIGTACGGDAIQHVVGQQQPAAGLGAVQAGAMGIVGVVEAIIELAEGQGRGIQAEQHAFHVRAAAAGFHVDIAGAVEGQRLRPGIGTIGAVGEDMRRVIGVARRRQAGGQRDRGRGGVEGVADDAAGAGVAGGVGIQRLQPVRAFAGEGDSRAPAAIGLHGGAGELAQAAIAGHFLDMHGAAGISHVHRAGDGLRRVVGQPAGRGDANAGRGGVGRHEAGAGDLVHHAGVVDGVEIARAVGGERRAQSAEPGGKLGVLIAVGGVDLEDRAVVPAGPVKVAGGISHEARWTRIILTEAVDCLNRAGMRRVIGEDGAEIIDAAKLRGAVELAIGAQRDGAVGVAALRGRTVEVGEHADAAAAMRQFHQRAGAAAAAENGGGVQIPLRIEDDTAIGV